MKTFARACLKAGLAIALLIPHTAANDLVVNDHLVVGLVAIALLLWAILDIAVAEDTEHATKTTDWMSGYAKGISDMTEPALRTVYEHTGHTPRNDYRSSELERLKPLLEETGSFASLTKRHD